MGRRPPISTSRMAGDLTRACRSVPPGEEEGGDNRRGLTWVVNGWSRTALLLPQPVCASCAALRTSSPTWGLIRYSSRRPFVSPLNTILFTEGFSPESSRSPSVAGVLLLLLQVRMPCSLACLCSCISAGVISPGDHTFSTTDDFPDFLHLLQATGALIVSAPANCLCALPCSS